MSALERYNRASDHPMLHVGELTHPERGTLQVVLKYLADAMRDELLAEVERMTSLSETLERNCHEAQRTVLLDEAALKHLRCPSCNHIGSIFVGERGYLTCDIAECPNPDFAESVDLQTTELRAAKADIKALQLDWQKRQDEYEAEIERLRSERPSVAMSSQTWDAALQKRAEDAEADRDGLYREVQMYGAANGELKDALDAAEAERDRLLDATDDLRYHLKPGDVVTVKNDYNGGSVSFTMDGLATYEAERK